MDQKRAVIFDCDGVMFDSRQVNISFYNHLLAHFGMPPMTDNQVAYVHMHTADESIRLIFHETPFVQKALAYRLKMNYAPFIQDMAMEPGLKELLIKLKPFYGLAVATNRSNTIGDVLEYHRLNQFFDIVVSSLDVERPKPHPSSLLKILRFFRISADEAVYVGDSALDRETARNAGVPFISYKNKELEGEYHVDHLMDIPALLGSISTKAHCPEQER